MQTTVGPPNHSLTYRLRASVRVVFGEKAVHLILSYPLKTIRLQPGWQAALRLLAEQRPVAATQLADTLGAIPLGRVVAFLNQLVFKGFLERSGHLTPASFPLVSVIIPVRNRPEDIVACLNSLTQLHYPSERLELIVVDDASQDPTPEAVAAFPVGPISPISPIGPIKLIRLKRHRQASFCRNVGARHAKGEILAFIDSDCLADPLWLDQLIPAFEDPSLAAMGGKVDAYYHDKPLDWYEKVKSSLMVSRHAKRSERIDPFFYVPACNFLIRRDLFLALKGFDVQLVVGEDVDLCWRLQNQGHALEFSTDGVVYHKHRNRTLAFCHRRFDYGTSEPLLQKLHPQRVKKLLLPPGAVIFWSVLVLSVLTGTWMLALGAGMVVGFDTIIKKWRFDRVPVSLQAVAAAVVRGYGAFAYHLCAFVSRYYLVWALPLLPLTPALSAVLVLMHLITSTVEQSLNQARMRWPLFVWFHTLEQLSYQLGVWWGCARQHRFSSVNPVIVWKGDGP